MLAHLRKPAFAFRTFPKLLSPPSIKPNLVGNVSHFHSWKSPQYSQRILNALYERSYVMLRLLAIQCEFIVSLRIRRSLQMCHFYSRLWGWEESCILLRSLRRILMLHSRRMILSAIAVSPVMPAAEVKESSEKNAEEKQDDNTDVFESSTNEFENINKLFESTIVCPQCRQRQVIDQKLNSISYCTCLDGKSTPCSPQDENDWCPFLERKGTLVWRKRHPAHKHLYSYKVYGRFDDITAQAFLEVQLNTDYRTVWDDTALKLELIESNPKEKRDVIYWLVQYPRFFQNRDYVFERLYHVDWSKRMIYVLNRNMYEHANYPVQNGVHRVTEYWSIMVIKANTEFDKPGIEYSLTYFDDPGMNLPEAVTNYVAATGLPNFVSQLAEASRAVQRETECLNEAISSETGIDLPPSNSYGALFADFISS